jgi:hypothetical protein
MENKLNKTFTDENINELKQEFCFNLDIINELVYWWVDIRISKGVHQFNSGLISKKDYEKLQQMHYDTIFKFCEDVSLEQIQFSTDNRHVMSFIENKSSDDMLMQKLNKFVSVS